MLIGGGLVHFTFAQALKEEKRYSPLTRDMLRPPGHGLDLRIWDLQFELMEQLTLAVVMPVLAVGYMFTLFYFHVFESSITIWGATFGASALLEAYLIRELRKKFRELRRQRVAYQAELATAQELNQLMRAGCHVFHDIPTEFGNVDHVVVSPSGVYAVNTKGYGKLKTVSGDAKVTIDNNDGVLRFPDRNVTLPVDQLEGEARWLSNFLTSSTGEKVTAEPMLAIPGWFIESRIGKGTVFVFNPVNCERLFIQNRTVISPNQMQRIAHQLDQKCRDVEPTAKKEKAWK